MLPEQERAETFIVDSQVGFQHEHLTVPSLMRWTDEHHRPHPLHLALSNLRSRVQTMSYF